MADDRECDIDDILCQLEALNHLRGLRSSIGEEKFKHTYPELEGLDEKITLKITEQNTSIREALERCGLPPVEELVGEAPPAAESEG